MKRGLAGVLIAIAGSVVIAAGQGAKFISIDDARCWAIRRPGSRLSSSATTSVHSECLDSGRHKDEVTRGYADAAGVGIQGTPVFFVNGRALFGAHPFAAFQKVIDEELSK